MTHSADEIRIWNADMIVGIPTLTTVTSSTAINVPSIIIPNTHHLYPRLCCKRACISRIFILSPFGVLLPVSFEVLFSAGQKKCHRQVWTQICMG